MPILEKKNYVVVMEDHDEQINDLGELQDNCNIAALTHINNQFKTKQQSAIYKTKVEMRMDINRAEALEWMREERVLAVTPDIAIETPDEMGVTEDEVIDSADEGDAGEFVQDYGSGYTGRGVKVALLDSGVNETHAAFLQDSFSVKNSRNFTDATRCLQVDDINGHGTYNAGILLGQNVAGHNIGVAPGIRDALVCKVLGAGTEALFQGLLWANLNGAEVVSIPLQARFPQLLSAAVDRVNSGNARRSDPIDQVNVISEYFEDYYLFVRSLTITLQRMLLESPTGEGSLLIAAAGNGSDHYSTKNRVSQNTYLPARHDDVISVGCFEKFRDEYKLYGSSNIGFDIGAPGFLLHSADISGDNNALIFKSGTSGATSFVAGVAALWAEKLKEEDANGRLNINLLREVLLTSANESMIDRRFRTSKVLEKGVGIVMPP